MDMSRSAIGLCQAYTIMINEPRQKRSQRRPRRILGNGTPHDALRVPVGSGSQISRHLAHHGVKFVSLTHRPPFFFLVRLYNSQCRVLAFPTTSFLLLLLLLLLLSWTRVFQFGTFNLCISFLTSSSQRIFGLPIGLFEMGFQACIVLTILVSCIPSI